MCLIDCAKCCLLKSYFLLIALYRSTCHCLYGLCCWKKVRNERYPWNPIGINYSKIAANIDNISLRPKNEAAEEVHALNHALLAWIKRTTAKKIKTANFGFPIGLPFTFLAIFLKMMIIFVLPMIVLYIIGYYIHWFVTTFRFLLQFVHICVDLIFNQLIKKMAMGFFRDIQVSESKTNSTNRFYVQEKADQITNLLISQQRNY
ncbi:MAG: hypothetical protein MHMPM18_002498 [Marteilia pararefringens]